MENLVQPSSKFLTVMVYEIRICVTGTALEGYVGVPFSSCCFSSQTECCFSDSFIGPVFIKRIVAKKIYCRQFLLQNDRIPLTPNGVKFLVYKYTNAVMPI